MLLKKELPSAKDARIYLSAERTFLGYIKLSFYSLSVAVFFDKMRILSDLTQKIHIGVQLSYLSILFLSLSILSILLGSVVFYLDLRYIEGGIEVAPKETTDPRIYMASERTFLAWVRTSIALIVFGFVIEKFEFFLLQLERVFNIHIELGHRNLFGIGILIILIGIFTLTAGMMNFYFTVRKVDSGYYRTNVKLYLIYGALLSIVCLLLMAYILRII